MECPSSTASPQPRTDRLASSASWSDEPRGPYTQRGYYKAEQQNARAFTDDGWYRSGAICRIVAGGNLSIEGRDLGVAAYKLPERLVLIDEVPTTKVGKIDKVALRADIANLPGS